MTFLQKILGAIFILIISVVSLFGFESKFFPGYKIETNRCSYIIKTPIYDDCYSKTEKNPAMVAYKIPTYRPGKRFARPDFYADSKIPAKYKAYPEDYLGTGYDRGHNCPNGIFSNDKKLQYYTFDMINIAPQKPMLNRRYWNLVEKFARNQKRNAKNVYVITGNCGSIGHLDFGENIPKYWFKIIYLSNGKKYYVLAPNTNKNMKNARVYTYFTNKNRLEKICNIKIIDK